MALGLRHSKKGTIQGMGQSTQLNDQGTAVTPVAYTSSGAIAEADSVITVATNEAAYTIAGNLDVGRILVITQSGVRFLSLMVGLTLPIFHKRTTLGG